MRKPLAVFCAALIASSAYTLPVRLITTATIENWSTVLPGDDARRAWILDESAILTLTDSLSLIASARYGAPDSSVPYGGFGAGLSYVLSRGLYADLVYTALFRTEDGRYSSSAESSINFENAHLYAGIRERARFDEADVALFSSAFAKLGLGDQFALWSTYTLIYDRAIGLDHAYWGYFEVNPAPTWGFTLGGSAYTFHIADPITTRVQGGAGSFTAGLSYKPSDRLAFTYRVEHFLGERDWNKTAHTAVADIRFR